MNINEQKQKLVDEKLILETELAAFAQQSEDGGWLVVPDKGDGTKADPIDNADITEDFEEKVARLNVLETQLKQVEKALMAVEAGTYGVCEVSGEKIPEDRLMAYPSATTIVEHSK